MRIDPIEQLLHGRIKFRWIVPGQAGHESPHELQAQVLDLIHRAMLKFNRTGLCHGPGQLELDRIQFQRGDGAGAGTGRFSGRQPQDWRMTSCVATRVLVPPLFWPLIIPSRESTAW